MPTYTIPTLKSLAKAKLLNKVGLFRGEISNDSTPECQRAAQAFLESLIRSEIQQILLQSPIAKLFLAL